MANQTIKKIVSPNLEADGRRNPFDMTHRRCFTALHGQLTPAAVMDLKPGDFVELQSILHTRTAPISSVPYVRMREHLDWFFVPYAQLWKPFDNFITQQSNFDDVNLHNTLNGSIPSYIPFISKNSIYTLIQDAQWGSVPTTPYQDLHKIPVGTNQHRLFQYLGYFGIPYHEFNLSDLDVQDVAEQYIPNVRFNPFRLAAYQKIYFDFYRNDKYEECDTAAYNLNDVRVNGGSQVGTAVISDEVVDKLTTMRYRWRNKDYFTMVTPNILPSSNFIGYSGLTSALIPFATAANQGINMRLQFPPTEFNSGVELEQEDFTQSYLGGFQTSAANGFIKNEVHQENDKVTAQGVRLALSFDRLLRRMYAAKNNYADQMKAIFGDAPIDYRGGFVTHIGGCSNALSFDTTYQTSISETLPGTQFGQIDNKSGSDSIKFRAHEHGVLMAIYSTSIDNDYLPYRIDRFNFKNLYQDYFNPHFQTLGKQPIVNIEFSIDTFHDEYEHLGDINPKVLGFVERYHEYKVPVDTVMGDFVQGRSNWVVPANHDEWNVYGNNFNMYNLTYDPYDLRNIIEVTPLNLRAGLFTADQFYIELVAIINKVSTMDFIGDEL